MNDELTKKAADLIEILKEQTPGLIEEAARAALVVNLSITLAFGAITAAGCWLVWRLLRSEDEGGLFVAILPLLTAIFACISLCGLIEALVAPTVAGIKWLM